MVPSNIFILKKMLKNANGKIDEQRLKKFETKATI